jgi:FMN phosphatase YigB (HAD superfamily)
MGIRAVVFDLGNVLVDVVHARAADALARFCRDGPQRFQDAITTSPALHRIERGEVDARAFFSELIGLTHCSAPFDDFCVAFCDIFIPVPEMIAANARLRARGMRTSLCSNTSVLHFEYLKRNHAFMSDFDGYFLSYEVKCMKPDPGIFRAVERGTGLGDGEIVYIDDRIENVDAAARRGWQAIHHVSPAATLERLHTLGLL